MALVLALLFLPGLASAQEQHSTRLRDAAVDAAWMGSAAALDLGVSRHALARCVGCYEANPLMSSVGTAAALKLGGTVVGVALADHLRQHGHPRGAKILRWGLVGLQVALAGHALRLEHQR